MTDGNDYWRIGYLGLVDLDEELTSLWEFAHLAVAATPGIQEEAGRQIRARYDLSDGADHQVANVLQENVDRGVTTRFFASGLLIAAWAAYESAIEAYAKHLGRKVPPGRDSFMTRAAPHFSMKLNLELHPHDADWGRLCLISRIRNALAHGNGRLAAVKEGARKELIEKVANVEGVTILDNEYLVISGEYARDVTFFILSTLEELQRRVEWRLQGRPGSPPPAPTSN